MRIQVVCRRLSFSFLMGLPALWYSAGAQSFEDAVSLPTSPVAGSLGQYGNVPVSLAVGTPNISIPLWEIKGRTLSVPLSVSYRASGVKVEDAGSQIGLGWDLAAGGVIARATRGIGEMGVNSGQMMPLRPGVLPLGETPVGSRLFELISPNVDSDPDTYFYNFLNFSGKFVFDKDGTCRVTPDLNFRVEFPFSTSNIIVTDNQGIKYYFAAKELTQGQEGNNFYTVSNAITSWYLTRVESYDSTELINFEYEPEYYLYTAPEREMGRVRGGLYDKISGNTVEWVEVNALRLRRITTNFGFRVEVIPGAQRTDLTTNARRISQIKVYYNTDALKTVDFETETIETTQPFQGAAGIGNPAGLAWANYRMYLKSLKISDGAGANPAYYRFSYYGRVNGKDSLPNRMSFSQDHWGYYNGALNNTLRPAMQVSGSLISGADREAHFPEMRAGALESIVYPTGGRTVFNYEAHRAGTVTNPEVIGGLRILEMTDYTGAAVARRKTYEYSGASVPGRPTYVSGPVYVQYNFSGSTGMMHLAQHPSCPGGGMDVDCNYYYILSAGSQIALGTTQGSPINYEYVIEREVGNGYTEYRYTTADQYPDWGTDRTILSQNLLVMGTNSSWGTWSSSAWPFVPQIDYSWQRGLLLHRKVFKEGSPTPVEEQYSEYEFKYHPVVRGVAWKHVPIGTQNLVYYCDYTINPGVARIKKQTTHRDGFTKITTDVYDKSNFLFSRTEVGSDNKTRVTEYHHPFSDAFDVTPALGSDLLKGTHKLEAVLRTSEKVNGVEQYRRENTYGEELDHVVLKTLREYGSGTLTEEQVRHYNAVSLVEQVQHTDDLMTSYIWAYNQLYPIAKAENVKRTDIFHTSFEETGANSTLFRTGKKSYNGHFVQPLSGLSYGLYHMTYWQLLAGVWTFTDSLVDVPEGTYTIDLTGHLDEIRFYPEGYYSTSDPHQFRANVVEPPVTTVLNRVKVVMTTFTHMPGVGVTSVTDHNNVTQHYYYDSLGRLSYIKDYFGRIIKAYTYNLKP